MKTKSNVMAVMGKVSLISVLSFSLVLPAMANTTPIIKENETQLLSQDVVKKKDRVAILDFDFSSVSNPIVSTIPGIAKGTSDILVNSLVNTGAYSVIERSQLEAVLAEQNLGASGAINASTAAQIGKILGVKYILIGSVTQFDIEEKEKTTNAIFFKQKKRIVTANVGLNIRMIDTSTAEIVRAFDGQGNAEQKDISTTVFDVGGGSITNNGQKLLNDATKVAVTQITEQMAEFAKN